MSKKDTHLKNGKDRERLALLGLSADPQIVQGPCPDDEMFAIFLEAGPAAPVQQNFVDHLAVCESCRQKWLILSEELAGGTEKKAAAASWLGRRSLFSLVGSACAIAVGVMLYLSIDYNSVPLDAPDFRTTELASDAPADLVLRRDVITGRQAERNKAADVEKLKEAEVPEPAADATSAQKKYRAPMSKKSATPESAAVESLGEKPLSKRASSQRPEEGFSAAAGAPQIDQEFVAFIDSFTSLCKNRETGNPESAVLKDTVKQGRDLLQHDKALIKPYKEFIEDIVQLLTSTEPVKGTELARLCKQAGRVAAEMDR